MPPDPYIRRATAQDLSTILDLMRMSLGEGTLPRTPEYWRWKHEVNPFGRSPVLVAEMDGTIVGVRAFMRWTWQVAGRPVHAARAVDTATHPDYRGRGIFRDLTLALRDEMEEEGVAFIYNTPNGQSRPGYLKWGWELLGRPTIWIRPVRPLRLATALHRHGLRGGERQAPDIDAESAGAVLDTAAVRSLIESLAATTSPRYHTQRTASYLRWRYADIPDFRYHAVVRGAGAEAALVVMRSRRRGALRELRLCEVVVGPAPAARRTARRLLRQLPYRADVDMVVAMRPEGPRWIRLLLSAGYVPAPSTGPTVTVYPLAAARGLPDPRKPASWVLAIGDLELF